MKQKSRKKVSEPPASSPVPTESESQTSSSRRLTNPRASPGKRRAEPKSVEVSGPGSVPHYPSDHASGGETMPPPFPVVGIGASAGGLEAFTELLQHLPPDTGMAFVLVQHLAPGHPSILPELLGRTTPMPVHVVTDSLRVKPNHVYVIPPNASMCIQGGALQLGPHEHPRGKLRSIDYFLNSLARNCGPQAVGVILSGTDFDGTAGLAMIKAEGGITFAQDEKSARFDSMPRSAILAGHVDLVLSPKKIAEELGRLAEKLCARAAGSGRADREGGTEASYQAILDQLRTAKGVDLTFYKPTTIQRRIQRRMVLRRTERLSAYVRYLRAHPEEAEALFQDVLINVTSFFRDPELFERLKQKIFPQLIENRTPDDPIRLWVTGCSSGQETYSYAMAYLEFAADTGTQVPLQIFATDLNPAQLDKARTGRYSLAQVQDLSPERLRRFFFESSGSYHISKGIREMCVFAMHDLLGDPPFSRMDLVSCRNLLIYVELALQKKVIPMLHYALKPRGFLVLGMSETIGDFDHLFGGQDSEFKIFFKKTSTLRPDLDLIHRKTARQGAPPDAPVKARDSVGSASIEVDAIKQADRLALAHHALPGVVINAEGGILQFRGSTGRFLEPMPGKASLNVLKMAREGLLVPLRNALQQAKKEQRPVTRQGVVIHSSQLTQRLDLEVIPLNADPDRLFYVVFKPVAPGGASPELPETGSGSDRLNKTRDSAEIARLKNELAAAREFLRSISDKHDAAIEEAQSSNEEAYSANEELQSINEELQTTKEELQSSNEELQTVNDEMTTRNLELHSINNDLNNVLTGVQMAIVVLDRDLHIRRATAPAEKIFNLVPTDAGRPITNIRTNLEFPELEPFIVEAIQNAHTKQTDVQDKQGRWLSLRVLPYRTSENKIDGAVLVLVDIDALKRSEERIKGALDLARSTIETVREPLLVLDADLRVESANRSFYHTFRLSADETLGRFLHELGEGQWNIPRLRELMERVLPHRESFDDFEVENEFERVGRRTLLLNARRMATGDQQPERILLAIEDITDRRVVELLRQSEERYRTLAESLPQLVWTCNPDGNCDYFNVRYTEYTGLPMAQLLGDGWREAIHSEDRERTCDYWLSALKGSVPYDLEFRIRRADGEFRWFKNRAVPLRDKSGAIVKWFGTSTDVDDFKRAHSIIEESERWLRLIMESVKDFALFTMDVDGRINSWNSGAESIFGYSEDEIIGLSADTLFTPEDRAQGEPEHEMVTARTKGCALDERWHQGKGGRRMFVSGSMRVIRDQQGQIRGFTKVARDITERKRTEDALRTSEERFRALFNLGPVGVYCCDTRGVIQEYNRRASELWGRAPAPGDTEERFSGAYRIFRSDGTPVAWEETPMGQVLRGEKPVVHDSELLFERPDGSRATVIVNITPLTNSAGEVTGAINCFYDLSERKRAEEALRQSHSELRSHAEELSRFNRIAVGRELRMIELKKEINELCRHIGEAARYPLEFEQEGKESHG